MSVDMAQLAAVSGGLFVIKKVTKAVIPAAGLGTRFLPATKASPKEMLPLFDKPLIQYAVEEAVASGIEQIIIITGRGKRAIEDHFDLSFELEATLAKNGQSEVLERVRRISNLADFCYVRQKEPRGLGHAILCAKRLIGDEPFAVLLADEIIDHSPSALEQMTALYQQHQTPILGIQQVAPSEVNRYGIIRGLPIPPKKAGLYRICDLVEKPSPAEAPSNLAIAGRYILTPPIFELLEKVSPGKNNEIQLTDALRTLAQQDSMLGLILKGRRFDAGDKLGFLKANIEMGLKNPELSETLRQYLKGIVSKSSRQPGSRAR